MHQPPFQEKRRRTGLESSSSRLEHPEENVEASSSSASADQGLPRARSGPQELRPGEMQVIAEELPNLGGTVFEPIITSRSPSTEVDAQHTSNNNEILIEGPEAHATTLDSQASSSVRTDTPNTNQQSRNDSPSGQPMRARFSLRRRAPWFCHNCHYGFENGPTCPRCHSDFVEMDVDLQDLRTLRPALEPRVIRRSNNLDNSGIPQYHRLLSSTNRIAPSFMFNLYNDQLLDNTPNTQTQNPQTSYDQSSTTRPGPGESSRQEEENESSSSTNARPESIPFFMYNMVSGAVRNFFRYLSDQQLQQQQQRQGQTENPDANSTSPDYSSDQRPQGADTNRSHVSWSFSIIHGPANEDENSNTHSFFSTNTSGGRNFSAAETGEALSLQDYLNLIFGSMSPPSPRTQENRNQEDVHNHPPFFGPDNWTARVFLPGSVNLDDYAWTQQNFDDIVTHIMNQYQQSNAPPPAPEELIASLPRKKVDQSTIDTVKECVICTEDLKIDETLLELPCKHVFHEFCIVQWLKINGTCAICRRNVSADNNTENQETQSQDRDSSVNVMNENSAPQDESSPTNEHQTVHHEADQTDDITEERILSSSILSNQDQSQENEDEEDVLKRNT